MMLVVKMSHQRNSTCEMVLLPIRLIILGVDGRLILELILWFSYFIFPTILQIGHVILLRSTSRFAGLDMMTL